jgi:hypothetical protein
MELKKALAVCLISLFSATLVVLIARSLDSQAASRLEPQLAQIAEELKAIRKGGGIVGVSSGGEGEAVDNGLMVYYFHSNARCPTCRLIESQSHAAVQEEFASQLDSGELVWKILNYEKPANAELAKKFKIQMPVVVLARMKDGEIADWNRLDQVWALVGDKPAFRDYVRGEIAKMLGGDSQPETQSGSEVPVIPGPGAKSSDIPLPRDPSNIPVPQ